MKIFVRVLNGDGAVLDVNQDMKILDVKNLIEKELKVPVNQQTLVLLGKSLRDDKTIAFYDKIKDGTKLHLIIKKPESLNIVLSRYLQKFYNEEQINLILKEFMKDFEANVQSLSLDDLERIATSYLHDENL
ncbi:ubiquitin-like protein 4A [Agrilus planipennis]|uniref:Ubiquitin-like protein 4A n=1 Tax=Agrilus planipennis TaxID=224129 RepID=A0A1W4XR76_AGRPL|nr:ubiquitin-like protein 4A [Agrilus planipennis]